MSITKTGWNRLKQYDELILYGCLLIAAVVLINESFSYRHNARIIPLLTLATFSLFLLMKMGFLIAKYTGNDQVFEMIPAGFGGIAKPDSIVDDLADDDDESESGLTVRAAFLSIGWVLAFTAVFYLFGIIYPIPVVLLAFLLVHYDAPFTHAVGITVLVFGLLYILFVELLNTRVYHGVVFEDILTLPFFVVIG